MEGRMLVGEPFIIKADNVVIAIRNDNKPFRLGDIYGGARVIKIEAYGKELEECGEGMTAAVTFNRIPCFSIVESSEYMA